MCPTACRPSTSADCMGATISRSQLQVQDHFLLRHVVRAILPLAQADRRALALPDAAAEGHVPVHENRMLATRRRQGATASLLLRGYHRRRVRRTCCIAGCSAGSGSAVAIDCCGRHYGSAGHRCQPHEACRDTRCRTCPARACVPGREVQSGGSSGSSSSSRLSDICVRRKSRGSAMAPPEPLLAGCCPSTAGGTATGTGARSCSAAATLAVVAAGP